LILTDNNKLHALKIFSSVDSLVMRALPWEQANYSSFEDYFAGAVAHGSAGECRIAAG
jgi:hypothetical protein